MNYEPLRHCVGGSAGSTVSAGQKKLWFGEAVHWRAEQKPFNNTWQPLPMLKSTVRATVLLQNCWWPLRENLNVQVRPYSI